MTSAVVLTKNEEKNIKKCLETLQWCDEIVVIDDYSEDRTTKIATKLGAEVYQHHLNDNFASQRNLALKKAKNKWILFVDADERVTPKLAAETRRAIKEGKFVGFYLRRQDFIWEKQLNHGETANVRLLRLGQKGTGEWQRRVHETWEIKGKVGELKNPLLHYPHPTMTEFLTQINFHSTLHAKALYEAGVKSSFFRIIVNPLGKFFQNYLGRLGFLDGMPGIIVALMMSFHSFLARAKLYMLYKK